MLTGSIFVTTSKIDGNFLSLVAEILKNVEARCVSWFPNLGNWCHDKFGRCAHAGKISTPVAKSTVKNGVFAVFLVK
jgi:hypothetical protein